MAYVVAYACWHQRKALQFSYTSAATLYGQFFDCVWIVPGTLTDD